MRVRASAENENSFRIEQQNWTTKKKLMKILIVEDDAALSNFIRKGFEAEHHAVDVANDGSEGRSMAMEFDYDLVVLDLNLPRVDGITLLKDLRQRKANLPVLILTARNRVEDRVQCLDFGADDYLVKPFSYLELSARARALSRRSHLPSESVLTVRDLCLDRVERKVERAGRHIELTTKEFALFEYLMRNAGRRLTRAMIIEHVWNLTFDSTTNVVDVYINYLRRKVDDGFSQPLIHTVRGVGVCAEQQNECEFSNFFGYASRAGRPRRIAAFIEPAAHQLALFAGAFASERRKHGSPPGNCLDSAPAD